MLLIIIKYVSIKPVIPMSVFNKKLSMVKGRVSQLKQKSGALNGSIRREIRALTTQRERRPHEERRLEELTELSDLTKGIRRGGSFKTLDDLASEAKKTEKELLFLDGQIDREIIGTYRAIFGQGALPDGFEPRLSKLFKRWDNALLFLQIKDAQLDNLLERVESASGFCDVLLREAVDTKEKQKKAVSYDSDYLNGFGERDRILLMDLLRSMASTYIHEQGIRMGLKFCCARIASYKMLGVPSPESTTGHDLKAVRRLRRMVEMGVKHPDAPVNAKLGDIELFGEVFRMYKEVKATVPEEIWATVPATSHFLSEQCNYLIESISGLMALNFSDSNGGGTNPLTTFIDVPKSEVVLLDAEYGTSRCLLSEMALPILLYLHAKADWPTTPPRAAARLRDSDLYGRELDSMELALLGLTSITCNAVVFTSSTVDHLFELFGLPERFTRMISEADFVLERPDVIRLVDDVVIHKTDVLGRINQLLLDARIEK
jgi:hypothetical protein